MTHDYGMTFPRLRDAAGTVWRDYTHHAFVEGLRDGNLPREAFLGYLVQDYVFLIHFARAWALAVTKSETLEEMRACAATVDALVNDEIGLHVKTCAAAGLSEHDLYNAEEHPANLAYTRYVLDAGHSGDFLDLLAALAPCVMGYGEIGARLGPVADDHPYADWIRTYAGADYQQVCRDAGALFDGAVTRRLGDAPMGTPGWTRLCQRFTTATRLEVSFWDMGLSFGG
ncbi:thiaminase (transcriptional activator TenA) [Roseovarius azorensis]|uniref:Aminopyrimidine aminohydrolase n=1 Tax=Roseovarius azorensis TaxID=1287727 RepID=A0A1H7PPE1_9RHOB|nr:thiaminase II [Roseovarius azorensis]SEL37642.1 thiaminase (transcriptional activator TenA) [Roseovarius azorensis]